MSDYSKTRVVLTTISFFVILSGAVFLMGWASSAGAIPQVPGVEVGPDHTRRTEPGQTLLYNHTLTNTSTVTDTFLLEASSIQGWPLELIGAGYSGGTALLPLQVSAQMTASFQLSLTVPPDAAGVTEITVITATSQLSSTIQDTAVDTTIVYHRIHLPSVVKRWPPIPYTPALNPVNNADQDNSYTVRWESADLADIYILEESTDIAFSDARVVYQGVGLSWTVPSPGKTPAIYHYRVRAHNSWGYSSWSDEQTVVIYPLFVGLELRWEGEGYIRGSHAYDVGLHIERDLNGLTDADTVKSHGYLWYDPNPYDFDSSIWDSYYSVTTGYFKASSLPSDPSWKWSHPWILPYDWQFSDGQTFFLDSQAFLISGPYAGYTAFGTAVQYWQLVNRDKFLLGDFGNWKQYVYPGDITLWYDAGNTRLILHRDVLRRCYYKGSLTSDTVQYIYNLTSANVFPAVSSVSHFVLQRPLSHYRSGTVSPVEESGRQRLSTMILTQ